MASNITTTNGVRIFTVVVLSGSLFFLIYHIGRRRLEQQAPKPDSAKETPVVPRHSTGSGAPLKRYFSHHNQKSYLQASSLTEAVGTSRTSPSSSQDNTGTSSRYRTDNVQGESSTCSDLSDDETDNPYIFSSTDAALRNILEDRGKKLKAQLITEAEQSFLEHLGHRTTFACQERPTNYARPTSPGDLSSFEKSINDQKHVQERRLKDVAGYSTTSKAPRYASDTTAAEKSKGRRVLPPDNALPETERDSRASTYIPTTSFPKTLLYCMMWCILSHSVSLFNRTGVGAKMVTFPAPFFRSTVHLIIQSILASCMLRWPMKKIFYTSWTTFLWRVVPLAVAATMDHKPQGTSFSSVCENLEVPLANVLACQAGGLLTGSRENYGQLTLAAVCHVQRKCKAWVPLIVFLLAAGFKLDGEGHSVFSHVLIISVGFMLAAYSEEEVENWSLTELSMGSVVSAFRLVATQNLLQNREIGLVSPVVTMRALAPAMALVTAVLSYIVDPWSTLRQSKFFDTPERSLLTGAHILVGALLETSVVLAELVVIYHSSANTMIIVAMLKEVALLTVGRYRRDDYTRFNAIGVGAFSAGVFSYAWLKYRKITEPVNFQDARQPISAPTGEGTSSSGGRSDFFRRTNARIRTEVSALIQQAMNVFPGVVVPSSSWEVSLDWEGTVARPDLRIGSPSRT